MAVDTRLPFSVLQICRQCLRPAASSLARPFSTTSIRSAAGQPTSLKDLSRDLEAKDKNKKMFQGQFDSALTSVFQMGSSPKVSPPHHLHIYATKHNTHMTLTNPLRNTIISKSTGNLGFKKATRGTYDAAYQLSAYMLSQIFETGLLAKIDRLEIVLRGFGVGREAISKVLLGPEGRRLRGKIVQVTDSTRLKFGGTRSRKPRRLG